MKWFVVFGPASPQPWAAGNARSHARYPRSTGGPVINSFFEYRSNRCRLREEHREEVSRHRSRQLFTISRLSAVNKAFAGHRDEALPSQTTSSAALPAAASAAAQSGQ